MRREIRKALENSVRIPKGTIVEVRVYGGDVVKRRVVVDRGYVVVICNEEEFQTAIREHRVPTGIGFPREDVTP